VVLRELFYFGHGAKSSIWRWRLTIVVLFYVLTAGIPFFQICGNQVSVEIHLWEWGTFSVGGNVKSSI